MRRMIGLAAALLTVTAACAAELPEFDATSTIAPSATGVPSLTGEPSASTDPTRGPPIPPTTTSTEAPPFVPDQLADLEIQPITIVGGDRLWNLTVAVAATPDRRSRGLMNVADLGDPFNFFDQVFSKNGSRAKVVFR